MMMMIMLLSSSPLAWCALEPLALAGQGGLKLAQEAGNEQVSVVG